VVPAVLLGRLAVDRSYQGKGLGVVLLGDALMRTARAELGVFAMVVDAKDEGAQRFYERFGFTLLPGAARRLCLPIATALRGMGCATQKWKLPQPDSGQRIAALSVLSAFICVHRRPDMVFVCPHTKVKTRYGRR